MRTAAVMRRQTLQRRVPCAFGGEQAYPEVSGRLKESPLPRGTFAAAHRLWCGEEKDRMPRWHLPSALAGGAVGGTVCYLVRTSSGQGQGLGQGQSTRSTQTARRQAHRRRDDESMPVTGARSPSALEKLEAFGLPTGERMTRMDGFVSCVDGRTRTPKWVHERLTKDSVRGEGSRGKTQWEEESGAPAHLRARLSHYRYSGYDRGHMAPAMNHKGSQEAMSDTFTLANCAPQVGEGFNRDWWARLEWFVRGLALRKEHAAVHVVTGPLYLPTRQGAGERWRASHDFLGEAPQLLAVPTHFFKAVAVENASGKCEAMGAFVVPNAPIPAGAPLEAFAVGIEELEAAAGMTLFPEAGRPRAVEERRVVRRAEQARRRMAGGGAQLALPSGETDSEDEPGKAKGRLQHLCAAPEACVLPPERFWLQGKKKGGGERAASELPARKA